MAKPIQVTQRSFECSNNTDTARSHPCGGGQEREHPCHALKVTPPNGLDRLLSSGVDHRIGAIGRASFFPVCRSRGLRVNLVTTGKDKAECISSHIPKEHLNAHRQCCPCETNQGSWRSVSAWRISKTKGIFGVSGFPPFLTFSNSSSTSISCPS